MTRFDVQPDGSALIRHEDGSTESVPSGEVAARYAALAGNRAEVIDEQQILEVLRAHMSGAQPSSETSQLPESLTQTSTPSE